MLVTCYYIKSQILTTKKWNNQIFKNLNAKLKTQRYKFKKINNFLIKI